MSWINARRDPSIDAESSLKLAPLSWKKWVDSGPASIPRLRRNVITRNIVPVHEQRPHVKSEEHKILQEIYNYFDSKKSEFESIAEFVTQQIFTEQGLTYTSGWITQGSGDGGFDFVGSLDLDPAGALKSSRQVVLGQAKCEKLSAPTNGVHIARLAARLRRGWIGVYVTTSYFSIPVQKEVLIDRYPVVLIDGKRLAGILRKYTFDHDIQLNELLNKLSSTHQSRIGFGDPEFVLN